VTVDVATISGLLRPCSGLARSLNSVSWHSAPGDVSGYFDTLQPFVHAPSMERKGPSCLRDAQSLQSCLLAVPRIASKSASKHHK